VSDRPIRVSAHARLQAARRGIAERILLEVARAPEQVVALRAGREVRQARRDDAGTGRSYLIRVVVDTGGESDVVITVYRTSKIEKYWSTT